MMDTVSADAGWGIESPLIDLGAVPLKRLLARDDPALAAAMRHAVEQAVHLQVCEYGGSRWRTE